VVESSRRRGWEGGFILYIFYASPLLEPALKFIHFHLQHVARTSSENGTDGENVPPHVLAKPVVKIIVLKIFSIVVTP
jgi:hypothetical protein